MYPNIPCYTFIILLPTRAPKLPGALNPFSAKLWPPQPQKGLGLKGFPNPKGPRTQILGFSVQDLGARDLGLGVYRAQGKLYGLSFQILFRV